MSQARPGLPAALTPARSSCSVIMIDRVRLASRWCYDRGIVRRCNWIRRLRSLRELLLWTTRHRGMSETQNQINFAEIKIICFGSTQALQYSVAGRSRYGPEGGRRLKYAAFISAYTPSHCKVKRTVRPVRLSVMEFVLEHPHIIHCPSPFGNGEKSCISEKNVASGRKLRQGT